MTPQEERNKRFENMFDEYYFDEDLGKDGLFAPKERILAFLTSEVNLTIEQVEKWVEEASKIQDMWTGDTIKVDDLLTFLKELKK